MGYIDTVRERSTFDHGNDFAQLEMDGLPITKAMTDADGDGGNLADLLVRTGLTESKTQARPLLQQQAIIVNDCAVEDAQSLSRVHHLHGRYSQLQRGVERQALLIWD